jgi:hypothetical protein
VYFQDKVVLDGKTLVSARDGIMLYDGAEIKKEKGRVYKVYRPLSELKRFNMVGIPITNDHVDHHKPFTALGSVRTSDLRPHQSLADMQSHELFHEVILCDDLQVIVNKGKKDLSLGYDADLIPAEKSDGAYDFVQQNITPHHLAVVENGRCGDSCKFTDKEQKMTVEELMAMIKKMPEKEKMAFMAKMKELEPKKEAETKKEMAGKDDVEVKKEPETKDVADNAKPDVADVKVEKQSVEDTAKKIADEAQKINDEFARVVSRASSLNCLPDDYSFIGKKSVDIMRDCVKVQHTEEFTDDEVKIAFKMLKPLINRYKDFGKGDEYEIKDDEIPSAFNEKLN